MQKNESTTTLAELKTLLLNFRTARGWQKFNDPYDLAAALSVETTELLQLLLWKNSEEVSALITADPELKSKLQDELADVFAYTLTLSEALGIDMTQAFFSKLEEVEARFPVEKCSTTGRKRWLE